MCAFDGRKIVSLVFKKKSIGLESAQNISSKRLQAIQMHQPLWYFETYFCCCGFSHNLSSILFFRCQLNTSTDLKIKHSALERHTIHHISTSAVVVFAQFAENWIELNFGAKHNFAFTLQLLQMTKKKEIYRHKSLSHLNSMFDWCITCNIIQLPPSLSLSHLCVCSLLFFLPDLICISVLLPPKFVC